MSYDEVITKLCEYETIIVPDLEAEIERLREVLRRAFTAADMDEREACWAILREESNATD